MQVGRQAAIITEDVRSRRTGPEWNSEFPAFSYTNRLYTAVYDVSWYTNILWQCCFFRMWNVALRNNDFPWRQLTMWFESQVSTCGLLDFLLEIVKKNSVLCKNIGRVWNEKQVFQFEHYKLYNFKNIKCYLPSIQFSKNKLLFVQLWIRSVFDC